MAADRGLSFPQSFGSNLLLFAMPGAKCSKARLNLLRMEV